MNVVTIFGIRTSSMNQTLEKKKTLKTFTSSGRVVMRPKRIMTTSSDDTAKRKKKLKEKNMKAELDRLRLFVKELKSKDEQISINESENKNLESTLNTNPIDIDENL